MLVGYLVTGADKCPILLFKSADSLTPTPILNSKVFYYLMCCLLIECNSSVLQIFGNQHCVSVQLTCIVHFLAMHGPLEQLHGDPHK